MFMDLTTLFAEAEELAEIGSWGLDLRTGEAMWTNGFSRIHGWEHGSVTPGVEVFLERVHPEDQERMGGLLESVMRSPETVSSDGIRAEYRAVREDGSVRTIRFHGRVESNGNGQPATWVGTAQDITDQRMTERELQAHYALSQALREWESFEEGVVGLLRRLGTALEFPAAELWTWDEERERIVPRAFWRAPGVDVEEFEALTRQLAFERGEGMPGLVWDTGEPHVTDDVLPLLVSPRRKAAESAGIRSGVAFPAIANDGPLAVVGFWSFDRRPPSERLVRTICGIGGELGRFLSGRRAELGTRRLTDRELEVLRLAAEGNSGPQIAESLFVSPSTIKTHFEHIYEKLGVGDRAAAVAHALRIGLIR
jgi:PAS domain S-box-containing protein